MKKITAAYNFVPLNKAIYTPEWAHLVSHDLPFWDGESGQIEVLIENLSPLMIANGEYRDRKVKDLKKSLVFSHVDGQYFIPGTSLKGMLRSVMEVFSFGRLKYYDDAHFGYRSFGGSKDGLCDDYKQILTGDSPILGGWLSLRVDEQGDERLYLKTCTHVEKIKHKDLMDIIGFDKFYKIEKFDQSIYEKQMYLSAKDFKSFYPKIGEGRLVVTGSISKKNHEYIFIDSDHSTSEYLIDDRVKEQFFNIYKSNNDYEKWLSFLRDGHQMAVFYLESKNKVTHLGWSRMMKVAFEGSIKDRVIQDTSNIDLDLTDVIFGTIDDDLQKGKKINTLKGRVQVGHAFLQKGQIVQMQEERKVILSSPKASFYPFYLKQATDKPVNYNDRYAQIAGRKRYPIHNRLVNQEIEKDDKEYILRINALKPNHKFSFKINLHNLKPMEIGAVLSALTLHGQNGVFHNLGMAKSLGYGKMKLDVVKLLGLEHDVAFYLEVFEKAMTIYCKEQGMSVPFLKHEMIQQLLGMARVHDSDDLKMMDMDNKEFEDAKKKGVFKRLPREEFNAVSCINYPLQESLYTQRIIHDIPELLEKKELDKASICLKQLRRERDFYSQELFKQLVELNTNLISQITEEYRSNITCFLSKYSNLEGVSDAVYYVQELSKNEDNKLCESLYHQINSFLHEKVDASLMNDSTSQEVLDGHESVVSSYQDHKSLSLRKDLKNLFNKIQVKKEQLTEKERKAGESISDKIGTVTKPGTLQGNIERFYKGKTEISDVDINLISQRLIQVYEGLGAEKEKRSYRDLKSWKKLLELKILSSEQKESIIGVIQHFN